MPKNVEIKAKVYNINDLISRVKNLCNDQSGDLLIQCDTFYKSNNGRLKLREFGAGLMKTAAELLFYDRSDSTGPKLSDYVKVSLPNENTVKDFKKILELSIGVQGILKKERLLFFPEPNIRIHIDKVENLGNYMEIEVCLINDMTFDDGEKIANDLLKKLDINESALISGAYIDAIEKN